MALILHLETATKVCSVSLAKNGQELITKEIATENFSHAENLNPFIEDVLRQMNRSLREVDAVAVSEGPGSYTGLRIGASTAKGLCYALDKPLIAINSLKALASLVKGKSDLICPLFDAMRMEVYAAVYDQQLNEVQKTEAVIVTPDSFHEILAKYTVLFTGPGAAKCQPVLQHANAHFDLDTLVSARGMIQLAWEKYQLKQFEDVAYFQPFYLKDFIAGEKKSLI